MKTNSPRSLVCPGETDLVLASVHIRGRGSGSAGTLESWSKKWGMFWGFWSTKTLIYVLKMYYFYLNHRLLFFRWCSLGPERKLYLRLLWLKHEKKLQELQSPILTWFVLQKKKAVVVQSCSHIANWNSLYIKSPTRGSLDNFMEALEIGGSFFFSFASGDFWLSFYCPKSARSSWCWCKKSVQ